MEEKPKISPNVLLPPSVTNIKAGIIGPQMLSSSGSATGNPRNKCALKPGYSLMGWIRLGNSGEDLAGTGGRVRPVSREELAKHNKQNDAWMAIRGKVYNVTRYMDYHPGGIDELMRGVGKDATKLFDEIHAFVNYSKLLAACYVGPLKYTGNDNLPTIKASKDSINLLPLLNSMISEIIPRLDWIQKKNGITFFIYTKQLSNPGLILQSTNPKSLILKVQIETILHEFNIDLHDSIRWPPLNINIIPESGKIEIILAKSTESLWTSYGTHSVKRLSQNDDLDQYDFEYKISQKMDFNHDSFEMTISSNEKSLILIPPLGFHLSIIAPIKGSEISRNYTPVPKKYLPIIKESTQEITEDNWCLNFLVKKYEQGLLSSYLKQREVNSLIKISIPKGSFKLSLLKKHRNILFLAAGSGITPFLKLLEPLLKRSTNRIDYLKLLYFNKTEEDIWCRDILESQASNDERFQIEHILSQPSLEWKGKTGHLNKDLLSPYLATKDNLNEASFVAICGPNAFNQLALDILKDLHFKDESYHIFQ